ncbi:MAG: GAF domain-containing protein [Magnetococcales bacterium]|nr:GAF domain-containing protein [Magnetococcales bacterium]
MTIFATPRGRFLLLMSIMAVLVVVVAEVGMRTVQEAAVRIEKERLSAQAKSQARFVETFHQWEGKEHHPEETSEERLVRFLAAAHEGWYEGVGKSGEIHFAQRHGDEIVFLYRQRHGETQAPQSVPWSSMDRARPMRLALSGESGVTIDQDYRGVMVLAAHEWIPSLRMGLVAKRDMDEIHRPLEQAIWRILWVSACLIVLGSLLFSRIAEGVIRRIRTAEESLSASLAALRKGEERVRLLLELHQEAHLLNGRQVCNRAIEIAVRLTSSQVGYLHVVNEDQRTISLIAWNGEALRHCSVAHDTHYPIDRAGIWADSIRLRKPVMHNDFQTHPGRQGYPEGHLRIERHLGVPVMEDGRIGLVLGVGNKPTLYDDNDIMQLQLIAEGVGKILAHYRLLEHLRQSRIALDDAQAIAHMGSWTWNLSSDNWEISPGLCAILDLPPPPAPTGFEHLLARIHPEERDRFREFLHAARQAQATTAASEFRVLHPDGREMTILARCAFSRRGLAALFSADEAVAPQLLGTIQDITASKNKEREYQRMNRALRALSLASQAMLEAVDEQRFVELLCRMIVEQAGYRMAWVGMALDDGKVLPVAWHGFEAGYLENLNITWWDNDRGRGPTGTAIRNGRPTMARHIPTDPAFAPWREQALARGYASSLALPLTLEQRVIGALNIYAAEPDAFDDVEIGFLADLANTISLGIASLRQTLRTNRLGAAVEQIEEMVLITDTRGVIRYANPALLKATGFVHEELLGRNASMLGNCCAREIQQAMTQGRTWEGNCLKLRKDGSAIKVSAIISPVKDAQGVIVDHVAVYRDVTRQEALEAQLRQSQKMEAIGTLAGGIAHDFNNILGVILGYAELVQKTLRPGEQSHEDLGEVITASLRARDLIRQLLAFSRQSDLRPDRIMLLPLIKETMQFLRAVIPAHIKLTTRLTGEDCIMMGNPTQIHQILMNLCTNAVQAMQQRQGAELTVSLEQVTLTGNETDPELPRGNYALIEVQDNGTGIPDGILSRIFDPFFTTQAEGEGTGLGLAVVHGHVTALQGAIRVESRSGTGSRFRVHLPLEPPIEERSKAPRAEEHRLFDELRRILVVEDEPILAEVMAKHLRQFGCQPVVAGDAGEALRLLRADPDGFDLVITDLMLADSTGDRLLAELRQFAPDLPVALTSGYQMADAAQEFADAGFLDFLPKPIQAMDLQRVLRTLPPRPRS